MNKLMDSGVNEGIYGNLDGRILDKCMRIDKQKDSLMNEWVCI